MSYVNKGFTIIEMMVVLLIISILAAVAYPRYNETIQRSYRAEGQAFLSEVAARQERYFAQNNHYIIPDAGADSSALSQLGLVSPAQSATKKYQLEITLEESDGGYTLIAQQQFNDLKCGDLTLNALGIKGLINTDKTVAECWR